jgi:hypothetical protein
MSDSLPLIVYVFREPMSVVFLSYEYVSKPSAEVHNPAINKQVRIKKIRFIISLIVIDGKEEIQGITERTE